MRAISASRRGPFTRSKKGLPTVTVVPWAASEKTGNTVPHSVTKATRRKRTFCTRKALSRDRRESSLSRLLSVSMRQTKAAIERASVPTMKERNIHPIADWAKEWTDGTGPPRLMNIPICARVKATTMSTMFHMRNMPRRFWTMIEWTKAVIASHGISAEFSTGSQAQYPPQPRIV